MRIGLISDTHIPDREEKIPHGVKTLFRDVDRIFHGGDIYSPSVLDDLEKRAPLIAARGDDDFAIQDERVREGHAIWVTHQFNPLTFYAKGLLTMAETLSEIRRLEALPDIFIFGHSHKPFSMQLENTLFINPGSATWPDHVPELGTIAMLTLSSHKATVEFYQLQATGVGLSRAPFSRKSFYL